ncbi:right-handed parallel beta-helix repeat-containing protein [Luteimonas sp. A501]
MRLPACQIAGPEPRPSRRSRPTRCLAAAATVFLLAASFPGLAAEWFVSTAGSDSTGTGTLQKPFRTIRHAAAGSVSSAGDTITIRGPSGNRTYNECEVRLRHRLVLRSRQGERAHIHCGNTSDVAVRIDVNASGSRVAGLEISGGYYGVMLMTNWEQGGPSSAHGARNVVLEDLLVHDTGRDGIKITPKSDNATIRRVEIHTTGVGYPAGTPDDSKNADGIDNVNGSGMVVEDSYIHDTATTGLYFKGGAADVVIQRNRIENTGDAGILVGFDTSPEFFDLQLNPGYYEAIRGTVRNNYVRNTGYAGIGMYASMDSLVANNTIVDAARKGHAPLYFGVTFQDWDPAAGRPANRNPMLRNNLVVQDGGRCMEIRYSSELGGLSGLSGSPGSDYNGFQANCRFRDARPGSNLADGSLAQWRSTTGSDANSMTATFTVDATGHLPAGSPAIDRGVALSQVLDDIDGQIRPARYDIGADEYMGASLAPVPRNGSAPLVPPAVGPATAGGGTGSALAPASAGDRAGTRVAPVPAGAVDAGARRQVRITAPAVVAWRRFMAWLDAARDSLTLHME